MEFLKGKSLIYKGNETVLAETVLKKKILILFYFTSFENDLCRLFDVKLKQIYQEAQLRKIEIAIIVVPCDSKKESYSSTIQNNYFDWYSLCSEDELNQVLVLNYGITHVPSLVVVTKSGTVVTRKGTQDVEEFGINVLVIWT